MGQTKIKYGTSGGIDRGRKSKVIANVENRSNSCHYCEGFVFEVVEGEAAEEAEKTVGGGAYSI